MKRKMPAAMLLVFLLAFSTTARAQRFTLQTVSDTLSYLVLEDGATTDRWRLLFPVYQMCVGDVDGDGSEDAIVGVVKATRYYPKGRRLLVFKYYKGHVRPLWMGSKLGGELHDFRFIDGRVRCLEASTNGLFAVAEYEWSGFGLSFVKFIVKGIDKDAALKIFEK